MRAGASVKCTQALWKRYHSGRVPVIPDIKCKSPGEGGLINGIAPAELAAALEKAGAPVISVVTEAEHYGGSCELFRAIRKRVSVPLLRKDFIRSVEQLEESAAIGAGGVLLIASMLDKALLFRLAEEAVSLGIEPLIETHSREQIAVASELMPTFLGINNRDISVWETDSGNVGMTEQLAPIAYKGALLLSESSLSTPEDVRRAAAAGAHAVLVGTSILRARDPVDMYRLLSGAAVRRDMAVSDNTGDT